MFSCSQSSHWRLNIKVVQLHQCKRKSPLAPSLGIYLSPLYLNPGWTQATDRYWAAWAQVVLGSNWLAGFIFESGLWKEMHCSFGLMQQQSAWILLYMCTSFSGSNSRLNWQSSEETWSQTHQHVKFFFPSLLWINKCHLLQSNVFSFHISPVLCLLALFWTQEQAVWNKLVSDTISPVTSSGLLRPPEVPFWLQKSQCLVILWCTRGLYASLVS